MNPFANGFCSRACGGQSDLLPPSPPCPTTHSRRQEWKDFDHEGRLWSNDRKGDILLGTEPDDHQAKRRVRHFIRLEKPRACAILNPYNQLDAPPSDMGRATIIPHQPARRSSLSLFCHRLRP